MRCIRLPDGDWPRNPGEIAKHTVEGQPAPGAKVVTQVMWFFIPPTGGGIAQIGPKPLGVGHDIDELPDGGIEVVAKPGNSNSILVRAIGKRPGWHGYIRDGEWVACWHSRRRSLVSRLCGGHLVVPRCRCGRVDVGGIRQSPWNRKIRRRRARQLGMR